MDIINKEFVERIVVEGTYEDYTSLLVKLAEQGYTVRNAVPKRNRDGVDFNIVHITAERVIENGTIQ